ncbi:MAG: DsbE family thiol:disulfide interchange protein, partial [Gammaproteobacteria bacterium]|nr:DsbE family thiol:disulfide interchange protein [Gammaproteobacteria bacterium]
KIKIIFPFIILFSLVALLYDELFYAKTGELPSPLLGESVPKFTLQTLSSNQVLFTQRELRGRVSLVNVWATWCYACNLEHAMLMKIRNQYHVPLYGIAYKDNANDVSAWLAKKGNPYIMTGNDNTGDVAIDLGVYGTPETFVISPQGRIIYRHIGSIDQKTWDEVLFPLIKKYE